MTANVSTLGLTHWVDVVGAKPAPQLPQTQKIGNHKKYLYLYVALFDWGHNLRWFDKVG
ncbi:MAG: hypothetical protein ACK54G_12210 [Pseudanabaena sp.]